jgi:N-acyl-D-aspartate/D-glutamate deacylase
MVLANDDEVELGRMLQDARSVLGLSDAGAHVGQLCDACFSTYLLEHWVRDTGVLSLQEGVRRLTSHAAHVYRLARRGTIAPGYIADLVAFDQDRIGVEELERVWDLPAGADRLIARSRGIHSVWVNGVQTRANEKEIEDMKPGVLIRAGAR